MPAGMLAPSALETTGPLARSASAISRVVVVLPLVADTRTTSRCWASRAEQVGVELERHPAADHRSAAAARGARHRRGRLARRHGQLGPRRQRVRVACHRPRSSLRTAPRLSLPATWSLDLSLSRSTRKPEPRHPATPRRCRSVQDRTLAAMRHGSIPGARGRVRPLDPARRPRAARPLRGGHRLRPRTGARWSRTCSPRCTRPRASASPRTRSACPCGCSSTTAPTTRTSAISATW